MTAEEEKKPRKLSGYTLGQPLEALSVDELDERVQELRLEIERLQAARASKLAAQAAAQAFFKS